MTNGSVMISKPIYGLVLPVMSTAWDLVFGTFRPLTQHAQVTKSQNFARFLFFRR